MRFVPYMEVDEIEVTHSVNELGKGVIAHFEKPDSVFCFKTAEIELDGLTIRERTGFNDDEMRFIADFAKNNREIMIEFSKTGGVMNA